MYLCVFLLTGHERAITDKNIIASVDDISNYKPLKNKKLFLDLPSSTSIATLEKHLILLGAVSMSSDTKCVSPVF